MTITRTKFKHFYDNIVINYRGDVAQDITSNVDTPLEFEVETDDEWSLVDNSSNFVFTAPFDCVIDVYIDSFWETETYGLGSAVEFRHSINGSIVSDYTQIQAPQDGSASLQMVAKTNVKLKLSKGDTYQPNIFHGVGANREITEKTLSMVVNRA